MTPANIVTTIRILLVPVFLILFFADLGASGRFIVSGFFVIIVATDLLDGYLARSRQEITRLGTVLDPVADKLITLAAMFALVSVGRLPLWIVIVLLAKELILVLGGVLFFTAKTRVISANIYGKIASFILFVGITAGLLELKGDIVVIGIGTALSLFAGFNYIKQAMQSV